MVKIFLSPVNIVTNYVTNSSQCSLHISPLPPEQKITKKKKEKHQNYELWNSLVIESSFWLVFIKN